MIRAFQIVVVVFWLAMTVLLVRDTWFPDESRFVRAEVEEVLEAMLVNWHESADMIIVDVDRKIGQLTISAGSTRDPSRPPSATDGIAEATGYQLSTTGALSEFGVELDLPTGGAGPSSFRRDIVLWRGSVRFDLGYRVEGLDLELRFPQPGSRIVLGYQVEGQQLGVEVYMGGLPLYVFNGSASELGEQLGGAMDSGLPALPGATLPIPLPLPTDELLGILPDAEALREQRPTLETTFGRTRIENQAMAVYLLRVGTATGDTLMQIYIGEDGRPVKIDTPIDIHAIAEVLAPEAWLLEDETLTDGADGAPSDP